MFRPILLTFVVTCADGRQGVVVNEADAFCFREYSWIGDVRSFRYPASIVEGNHVAVDLLVELLMDLDLERCAIGIEKTYLPAEYFHRLQAKLASARLIECTDIFEATRLIKTEGEIEIMRHACRYADESIYAAFSTAEPFTSEKTVATQMQSAVLRFGADGLAQADVHSGVHSTVVHALASNKSLEPGEVVHVDFGAIFGGYRTDLARNAIVGKATARQAEIYGGLCEIQREILKLLVPGAAAADVFAAGMRAFDERGLVHPWGTLGHSIGLSIHEGFELSRNSERSLASGMIVNIEPSHIEPDDARYHIEDSVLITSWGPEVLSNCIDTGEMFAIT